MSFSFCTENYAFATITVLKLCSQTTSFTREQAIRIPDLDFGGPVDLASFRNERMRRTCAGTTIIGHVLRLYTLGPGFGLVQAWLRGNWYRRYRSPGNSFRRSRQRSILVSV